ncbi:hypothetical protein ACOSP7_027481 [Xanthoceras sorbifolium]
MIRLRAERFSPGSYNMLYARWASPFQVLKKLGPNAYVIDLPPDYIINSVFNSSQVLKPGSAPWVDPDGSGQGVLQNVPPNSLADTPIRVPFTPKQTDTVSAILDHQFVSTRREGYWKFLVRWANKRRSESMWLQGEEVNRFNAHLYHGYLQQHLLEASSLGGRQLMHMHGMLGY